MCESVCIFVYVCIKSRRIVNAWEAHAKVDAITAGILIAIFAIADSYIHMHICTPTYGKRAKEFKNIDADSHIHKLQEGSCAVMCVHVHHNKPIFDIRYTHIHVSYTNNLL